MRDLMAELKELRLHGMATAWAELTAQGESNTASSKWLLEHLLEQEHTDRAMRSVSLYWPCLLYTSPSPRD